MTSTDLPLSSVYDRALDAFFEVALFGRVPTPWTNRHRVLHGVDDPDGRDYFHADVLPDGTELVAVDEHTADPGRVAETMRQRGFRLRHVEHSDGLYVGWVPPAGRTDAHPCEVQAVDPAGWRRAWCEAAAIALVKENAAPDSALHFLRIPPST